MFVLEKDEVAADRQKSIVHARRELFVSQRISQCIDMI